MTYAEPVAATAFSFLAGASHPAEMVARAHALGMAGIGIADRNTVAGVVRAHRAWRDLGKAESGLRLIVGARLGFVDGTPDVVAYPMTRAGWGRLTRLLTLGNRRTDKGDCELTLADLQAHTGEIALIAMAGDATLLRALRATGDPVWLAATMPRGGRDARLLAHRRALAAAAGVPLIATNDALYATPAARPLHDVMTAIRHGRPVHAAGRALSPHAERHLKPPAEMARLFAACPEAITATGDLFAAVDFTLDELKYEYPHEPVPAGWAPQDWLEHLVIEGGKVRFPQGLPDAYRAVLAEEFALIRHHNFAYYFLTVHDIVAHARGLKPPILCQGRGSAANSLVCYFLGITPIDPVDNKLLFSRFLSEARTEPPDIDVDFEHERREEVIQYIYDRYGRERAGIAATVIHYRQRSAIREVGKALGLTEDVTARLAGTVWGSYGDPRTHAPAPDEEANDPTFWQAGSQRGGEIETTPRALRPNRVTQAGFDPDNPELQRLADLVAQLLEMPRHLSQHVGGFVLTQGRLDEIVPIHNGAMPERTFIEWDKDDIDTLGLMKVDVLALGMLTCIRKCFDLMRMHGLGQHDLATIPNDDPATWRMLQRGDSIGTFQVESRAQIAMLPRMKPKELYDLVIQVAIVRPGPIQGGMVHPYLRRRTGEEAVTYPSAELKTLLERTYGVPLFQEQAMSIAMVAAGYTGAEADQLRRDMAAFRRNGRIENHHAQFVGGMVARGYERDFAERCFEQIKGFADYGFPESHAQAFGWLAWVSSWLKCNVPAAFTCALLNSQPMGFYAPAQLVADARAHAVEVRPADVTASHHDSTLEGERILRLGLRQIDGWRPEWSAAIAAARAERPFADIEDVARRAALPPHAMARLADADAFGALGASRREAGWEVRRLPPRPAQLSLFAAMDAPELGAEPDPALPLMPLAEEVVADYQTQRLSLKGHPMQFLRGALTRAGIASAADVNEAKDGTRLRMAGVVLIRQRPGKGNAIFITLEDETGIVNALLWARDFERQRAAVMAARLMLIAGEVQRSKEGVVHLMAREVRDRTDLLSRIDAVPETGARPEMPHHPRNGRVLPRSRDFH